MEEKSTTIQKTQEQYRDYSNVDPKVLETYRLNHKYQTFNYGIRMRERYMVRHDKAVMGLWDCIELCNEIQDDSDPDLNLPQIYHSIQTAENLRKYYPDRKDLHLVGLIHDIGKVMLLPEFGELPQWSVVGDTFPVGCMFSDKIVFSEFFSLNPDSRDNELNTKYGVYYKKPNCGFDNVRMSWGHDEYLYYVLRHNPNCKLSDECRRIIRYHSFYAFHKENEYHHLADENDMKLKPMLQLFSQCDLYSKDDNLKLDIDYYKSYYGELIDEYCPGKFNW
ncbi:inositol oxygenase [Fadolivirus algeromassiliense]|jgi:inositol oxygenase|uniref:Inositol oxygenase n=1 Tax=Fadolivirus FV1/VV64 TaxID=3070911 RepID=A0A7D3R1H8_9VIRU|nr:inositol oxygenase [Fadolivirus algeromassiliense]QKF94522.1 inositol oxygenase [Fadolivirus FV1/VV64]